MEKNIKIAAKLYQCRDTARRFFKDDYNERINPYKELVIGVMGKYKIEAIPALLKISEFDSYKDNGMAQMLFMTSVVEILEPSE